jgi:CRISPR-associated endonuclease/helicase Cas3
VDENDVDENGWHSLEDIHLLARMAALLHDLGKANADFQKRLRRLLQNLNLYRHEWVSLRLFLAFVGQDNDEGWLNRLAAPATENEAWQSPERLFRDGLSGKEKAPPFSAAFIDRAPLAAAIAWLIVSHHRLPVVPEKNGDGQQLCLGHKSSTFGRSWMDSPLANITHEWNEQAREPGADKDIAACWRFERGLPVTQTRWREEAAEVATRLIALRAKAGKGKWLDDPYVMHLARLALMLADHHYSALPSRERERKSKRAPLFANTAKGGQPNQLLDEHLLGVAKDVASIARDLPGFTRSLPRLARHRGLARRTANERFVWQNKAADAASAMREPSREQGAFIVNMASTGCGKTLANARILYALADPREGMRATFALGLRTLTLQTGRSYRENLRLDEDELAVRVGGEASRALFEYYEQEAEASGSASGQALMEDDDHVLFAGPPATDGLLAKTAQDRGIQSLLVAPLLVCTIDHLTPATEAQRGGRQIAPMLRLMSSDLALDELDDFALSDLPALTRLVHWAGLLGARVLISSATLPPALVEGLYLAYRAGRSHFLRNRGSGGGADRERDPVIACLWVDEFGAQSSIVADAEVFRQQHAAFVEKRVRMLEQQTKPCRRGEIVPLTITGKKEEEIYREFAAQVRDAMIRAHDRHHEIDPVSGKTVSFGLVRMANIQPLFAVARALFRMDAPPGYRIHLCVYHSQFPMLLRSDIERRLDTTLNRREPAAVYALPEIREALDRHPEEHHLFVVLGSPVTEVGRDHDYDWAVVEPSSMRSIIQLAGRVQRHRQKACPEGEANILIFSFNLRHFRKKLGADGYPKAVFVRPGFEDENQLAKGDFRLTRHDLRKLMHVEEYRVITARPRVQTRPAGELQAKTSLVDLEHVRLATTMLPNDAMVLNAASAWLYPQAALTWALPQQQAFRDDSHAKEVALALLPDEDDEETLILHCVYSRRHGEKTYVPFEGYRHSVSFDASEKQRITPWGRNDLCALLRELAEARGESLRDCAKRFATLSVPGNTNGWFYHPALGFARRK